MTAIVTKGLAAGERVVINGQSRLDVGSHVAIKIRRPRAAVRAAAGGQELMNISEVFIRRPIATSLLMAALALVGIVAFPLLPVAPLPQVDFPTIQVTRHAARRQPRNHGAQPWPRRSSASSARSPASPR